MVLIRCIKCGYCCDRKIPVGTVMSDYKFTCPVCKGHSFQWDQWHKMGPAERAANIAIKSQYPSAKKHNFKDTVIVVDNTNDFTIQIYTIKNNKIKMEDMVDSTRLIPKDIVTELEKDCWFWRTGGGNDGYAALITLAHEKEEAKIAITQLLHAYNADPRADDAQSPGSMLEFVFRSVEDFNGNLSEVEMVNDEIFEEDGELESGIDVIEEYRRR